MTGAELQALRWGAGLTQAQAAELIGFSLRHYQALEGGERSIRRAQEQLIRRLLAAPAQPYPLPEAQADLSRPEQQSAVDAIKGR